MNWEETILFARSKPEFEELIRSSYLENNLHQNVERFSASEEFMETLKLIERYLPNAIRIADIGAGNGTSAASFALKGFQVIAVEPYKSDTVGYGAIASLKEKLNLTQLTILNEFGENLSIPSESCDVVYIRQAMHHASDLSKFISEATRILKKGGLLLGIREHVIINEPDKQWFLENHPLQKFYGGENAYTLEEYTGVFQKAGLEIQQVIKYFDSVINYYPMNKMNWDLKHHLKNKIGKLSQLKIIQILYKHFWEFKYGKLMDETKIPGRMYSFISVKPIQ